MPTLSHFLLAVVQALALFAVAPLISGLSRFERAKMHTRRGPSIFQDYRDIYKLLRRQDLAPSEAGRVFQFMPVIMLGALMVIATGLPMLTRFTPIPAVGDLITIVYLFALVRFFFSLSGLDSGSSFAGIGASRELTMGVLVEPIMLLALFVAALVAGSTNLGQIGIAISSGTVHSAAATLLAAGAFAFALYIELGKLPYDMAEAEQELQEGPLTEYSGPSLALVKWGLALKQTLVVGWFIGVFLPFGSATEMSFFGLIGGLIAFVVKLFVIFGVIAVIENSVARARFRLAPQHSWLGVGAASLAFVFYLVGL
ncbi:NADH-quinone oxidoreductase subunit H [Breoghania sp. JC706]|uniref:respiratory chain complex I subunit 1 family protein n=1 Tax=Breoghania sp. JC706 TaxID=3117732 RepID=UPI0030092BC3